VALVGATQGFSTGVSAQFDRLGVTTLQVMPQGRGVTLTSHDVDTIQNIAGVQYAIPFYRLNVALKNGGTSIPATVIAIDTSKLGTLFPGIDIYDGRAPLSSETTSAIIGSEIATPSDPTITPVNINQIITATAQSNLGGRERTASRSFLVTGSLTAYGQGLFINPDDTIFVPIEAGRLITGSTSYSGLYVAATSRDTVNSVSQAITDLYGNNMRVITISSLLSSIQSITGTITTMLTSIASISLAVAFMGITTTMFTSVNERVREIGITKALGYSGRTVMLFFLMEAVLTGLIGGIVGALSGAVLSNFIVGFFGGGMRFGGFGGSGGGGFGGGGMAFRGGGGGFGGAVSSSQAATATQASAMTITPALTPELILGAILLATAIGALAGLIPAWRASRLTPVEALRHE
jgi:putative ABC transport system permease protein